VSRIDRRNKIDRPRGTRDLFPDEMEKRRACEAVMREVAESYGYKEIQTPTFESLELFTIKSGEEIVEEIYAFKDKSGRELALRPELTAPVLRAFVNECSVMPKPLRFYYFANCFRYERPQKARYREFWQFGVELIGSASYLADAEVILLANDIMKELKLDFELKIGHVGLLRHLLRDVEEEEASKIMRLIDKKDIEELEAYINDIGISKELKEGIFTLIGIEGDREILKDVEYMIPDFDLTHIKNLCDVLDSLNIEYSINLGIARGLDYYTGVVFEAYAKGLGAQNQVCGGGSYRLAHLFGGQDIPSTGFALGFDRIAEICRVDVERRKVIVVVNLGFEIEAFRMAELIRKETKAQVIVDVMGRGLKKQLSYANDVKADWAIIVGERELQENKFALKDMRTGEQKLLKMDEIIETIQRF
jgi:histidyl-tRNA synthetase